MMHCRIKSCHKSNDGTLKPNKKEVCDECLSIQILCPCGCNQLRSKYTKMGYECKYIKGHDKIGKHPSEEHNRKNSKSHKGKIRTEESKRKQSESLMGHSLTEETRQKISKSQCGEKNHNYGKSHTEEWKKKKSESQKGEKNCNWHKHPSEETRIKQSESHVGKHPSEETIRKHSELSKGEKNGNWKGGITPVIQLIRNSLKYDQWRTDIFKKDGYTCQECGDDSGGNLNAHHNKRSFSSFMKEIKGNLSLFDLYTAAMMYEPLWDVNNGITLCEDCHRKKHKKRVIR